MQYTHMNKKGNLPPIIIILITLLVVIGISLFLWSSAVSDVFNFFKF